MQGFGPRFEMEGRLLTKPNEYIKERAFMGRANCLAFLSNLDSRSLSEWRWGERGGLRRCELVWLELRYLFLVRSSKLFWLGFIGLLSRGPVAGWLAECPLYLATQLRVSILMGHLSSSSRLVWIQNRGPEQEIPAVTRVRLIAQKYQYWHLFHKSYWKFHKSYWKLN